MLFKPHREMGRLAFRNDVAPTYRLVVRPCGGARLRNGFREVDVGEGSATIAADPVVESVNGNERHFSSTKPMFSVSQ